MDLAAPRTAVAPGATQCMALAQAHVGRGRAPHHWVVQGVEAPHRMDTLGMG